MKYNRHYEEGFTTVMTNDLYDVEEQLKNIDENLYLMWNPHTGEHLIMDDLVNIAVMRIPQIGFPELSSQVVTHFMMITHPSFNALEEVEKSEQKKESDMNKRTEDMSQSFAKDVMKYDGRKSVYMGASS